MPVPTPEMWNRNTDTILRKTNFPKVIGSIDGKHIHIQAPDNSGSLFFCYKDFFSIVLIAIADANCRFMLVDIGKYGSQSDSAFGKAYLCHDLAIPQGRQLPGYPEGGVLPLTFIADAAFPLHDLLCPYAPPRIGPMDEPEKIFNYLLSCACRVVENAFGILAQRFRLYHRKLSMTHEHTKQIVQATTVLHNFIMCETDIDMNAV